MLVNQGITWLNINTFSLKPLTIVSKSPFLPVYTLSTLMCVFVFLHYTMFIFFTVYLEYANFWTLLLSCKMLYYVFKSEVL